MPQMKETKMFEQIHAYLALAPNKTVAATLIALGLVSGLPYLGAVIGRTGGHGDQLPQQQAMISIVEPARAATVQMQPIDAAGDARRAHTGFRYAIGDRLKITFYEQLVSDSEASARSRSRSLVERTELSGEYVVQLSGDIYLPIIGHVAIAQRAPEEAEAALVRKIGATIGDTLKASIVVTDREPVYLLGATSRSGVYKYSPGMVVAQVLALSGNEGAGGGNWQQIDVAREEERSRKSLDRLKRQLALIDVLVAEGMSRAARPSARLIELAGQAGATALLDDAQKMRQLERARHELQIASLEKLITATRANLKTMHARQEQLLEIVRERTRRRDEMAGRVGRGVSTETLMIQARNELVEIQTAWHELRTSVARAEDRILELERDRDQARLAAEIDNEQKLRAAHQAVSEEEVMVATIGQLLLKIAPAMASRGSLSSAGFTLVRRTPNGPQQIPAELMTPLEPGDLVRVVGRDMVPATP